MHMGKVVHLVVKSISDFGKLLIAGAGGAAFVLGKVGHTVKHGVEAVPHAFKHNSDTAPQVIKEKETAKMKKNTLFALVAALVAIGGALGALYVYIRRREKELYEYEQLLFSEEFNNGEQDSDVYAPLNDDEIPLQDIKFDEE